MKKIILGLAVLVGSSLGIANATVFNRVETPMEVLMPADDGFVTIDVKDLPEAIVNAIAKNYQGSTIKKAEVKEGEEGNKVYKIVVVTTDEEEVTVLMKESGAVVDPES